MPGRGTEMSNVFSARGRRPDGRRVVTEALKAGLLDEVVLHQVPGLLGGGRPFFQELPGHVALELVEVVPPRGVTHLHYRVAR